MFGRPLGPVHRVSGLWGRRIRWKNRSLSGLVLFSDVGGLRGSRERNPARGMWEGFVWVRRVRWISVCVRHHGLLRLARIRRLSATCVGQFDAFFTGVPDRQALVDCVAQWRVVGLYEGVPLGKVGLPGVVVVDGRFRRRWLGVYR